jgi:hypothetical protein
MTVFCITLPNKQSFHILILKVQLFSSVLLILVSQRVGVSPNVPKSSLSVDYDYTKIYQEKRGAPATNIEWMILAYVAGIM